MECAKCGSTKFYEYMDDKWHCRDCGLLDWDVTNFKRKQKLKTNSATPQNENSMSQETQRTFTSEQQNIMYRALIVLSQGMLSTQAAGYAQDTLAHIAAIDSAPQAGNGVAGRYVVCSHGYGMGSEIGETWGILDTVTGHGVMPHNQRYWYPTEHEAQQEAARLNTDLQGNGGTA